MTTPSDDNLTPIMRAADLDADPEKREAMRAQAEASKVLGDIEGYVAETDPSHLDEAEAELNQWSVPGEGAEGSGDEGSYVAVREVGSETEAIFIEGILDDAGIPCVIVGTPSPYGAAIAVGSGAWGGVYVPASELARANEVLEHSEDQG